MIMKTLRRGRVHEIMAEESSERSKYKALDTWPSRNEPVFP